MAGSNENPGKSSKGRFLLLLVTGIAACGAGAYIGRELTTPAPLPPSDSTSALNENTQALTGEMIADAFSPTDDPETSAGANDFADDALTEPVDGQTTEPSGASADSMLDAFGTDESGSGEVDTAEVEAFAMTEFHDDSSPVQINSRERHVTLADEELRIGNYDRAIRIYTAVLDGASGVQEAAVRFRLALAMESLGEYQAASEQYRALSARFSTLSWATAARMGEARCIAALGQTGLIAEKVLRFSLLDESQESQRVRGEFLHIAGRAFCHAAMDESAQGLLKTEVLFMPVWLTEPNREFEFLSTLLKDLRPVAAEQDGFAIVQQSDRLPDETFVKARTGTSDLEMLLKAVCRRAGFELKLSPPAARKIVGRTQHIQVSDLSFSLMLDGLCAPFGLSWRHEAGQILVRSDEELTEQELTSYHRELGVRLLNSAIVIAPDSPRVSHSRLALGVLQHAAGKTVEAAQTFRTQLSGRLQPDLYAEAALNLGKCRLKLGQFTEAQEAFLLAVDSGTVNVRASTAAYLFYSRMLIESGQYARAVSTLFRAVSLCRGTEFEAQAAVILASAYLMNGSPQGASDVLMKRRELMATDEVRSTSAFLSALSKFRATVLPGARQRAARSVVTALSRFDASAQFGAHWSYLRAEACDEVGLTKEAVDAYAETVQRQPAAQLRGKAMLKLANHYRFEGRLAEASELLNVVSGQEREEFGRQISMQAALLALKRGNPDIAIEHCRFIVEDSSDPDLQRSALQTMGQAFELMNDHKSAVYCFAGMLPAKSASEAATPKEESPDQPVVVPPVDNASRNWSPR